MPSPLATAAPAAAGRGDDRGHRGTAQHRTPWPYRLVLVGAGLAAIGLFALLRVAGATETYNDLFHLWRVEPFRWPFLDIHAVLSAVECHRLGWDVFEQNPCDVLERVHVYSPVWLALARTGIGTADLGWVGPALIAAFLGAFAWMANPQSLRETAIYLLALFSSATLYAVERANNDLVIFVMIVLACKLFQRGGSRVPAYATIFLAGLLKFYPIAAMGLALKEKGPRLAAIAVTAGLGWAVFLYLSRHDLAVLQTTIPNPPPTAHAFAGINLFEEAASLLQAFLPQQRALIARLGIVLYSLAILLSLAVSVVLSRRLSAGAPSLAAESEEAVLFLAGGLMIIFAFFVGKNTLYRGVHLLLLPFLIRSRREAGARGKGDRLWAAGIGLVLFLMWWECLYGTLLDLFGRATAAKAVLWMVWELTWWGAATAAMSLVWLVLSQAPVPGRLLRRRVGGGPELGWQGGNGT